MEANQHKKPQNNEEYKARSKQAVEELVNMDVNVP